MTSEKRITERLADDLRKYFSEGGQAKQCKHGETADTGDHDFSKRERFIINGEKWKPKGER